MRPAAGCGTSARPQAPDVPTACIETLIERYAGLLLDAHGVLVASTAALPGAAQVIDRLNRLAKPYCVVTNDAARLPETTAEQFQRMGLAVPPERIVTAGILLEGYFAVHGLAGAPCAVLGTADSRRYVERAGGRPVPAGDDFAVLVVGDEQGFPFLPTVDAVLTRLLARIEAGKPVRLVVPNPDLIYPTAGGGVGITAASVAGIFEGVLRLRYPERSDLVFDRLGKPHAPLFEAAIARLGTRDVLMIGDQLETDIRGAGKAGLDSALVTSGVTSLTRLRAARRHLPTFLLTSLEGV